MENLEKKVEKEEEKKQRVISSFQIITKTSEKSGNDYYILEVETFKQKKAQVFLTESQKALIDEIGITNCSVDVETRHSEEKKKDYDVIALRIGEEGVFDFFPKDRAFISLAKLQAKKFYEKH